jgi:signal transduction histidine kinase
MNKTREIISIYWLIKLRWISTVFVILVTVIAKYFLQISIQDKQIYVLSFILLLLNLFSNLYVKGILLNKIKQTLKSDKAVINFQISTDLLILTGLLHYSGSIENPFIIVYIFHMILASVMLSVTESIIQTSFALLLLGLMVFLEFFEIIPHYSLDGFVSHELYLNAKYLGLTGLVFILVSYTVLYMTNFIVGQLKKFERINRIANLSLLEKDEIKNKFVLRLTHDLKSHIYTIQSLLSVLRSNIYGKLEDTQEELMNRAYNRTVLISTFIKDLLNLTEMQLSDNFEMQEFSISKSVRELEYRLRKNAKAKSIDVNIFIDDQINCICANQFSIEQLLDNLLNNAIKYTNEKGRVGLRLEDKTDAILMQIYDSGIGIPADSISNIYQEFFRAENAKEFTRDGAGMGLSIVQEIVNKHQGKIWFESKENVGTTFYVSLPKQCKIKPVKQKKSWK